MCAYWQNDKSSGYSGFDNKSYSRGDNVPDDKKDVTTGEQGGGNATDPWDIPSIPNTFIGESRGGQKPQAEPSDKGQQRPIKP